ncbi:MAG: FKBP-type peptidyl-prolyl cis-trans isomerase [Deltaproteobacteria bacterium]|nr:FKBP-type peptidyl-prolyl cis-trans isomerase [Deltaproteobacteria bacterium]
MRNLSLVSLLSCGVLCAACNNPPAGGGSAPRPLTTEEDKTFYAMGLMLARNVGAFNLQPAELDLVVQGVRDGVAGKPQVELNTYGMKINEMAQARQKSKSEGEKTKGKAFLEKAATEQGAQKTDSGLIYFETTAGGGESPAATDTVKVHYKGTLTDGTEFDSSFKRNAPAEFPLNGVIKCWTEGVGKMKVGGKARLVCPSDIAYGDRGHPPTIPGGAVLVFEVELLEIVKKGG